MIYPTKLVVFYERGIRSIGRSINRTGRVSQMSMRGSCIREPGWLPEMTWLYPPEIEFNIDS